MQHEKLKEVKARLNFEGCSKRNSKGQEVSQHSESRTPNVRGEHRRGRRFERSRSMSGSPKRTIIFSRIRRDRSESPSYRSERTESIPRKRHHERTCSPRPKVLSESEDSRGGHWNSKSKKKRSSIEDDDLSQPWIYEEIDPFTSRIRYFELPKKTRMPNNVKTYDGSDDPEDHLKIFQTPTKVERWAMRTWCHMFNSTLTGSVRRSLGEKWQLPTKHKRKHLRRGSSKKLGEKKINRRGDFRNQQRSERRRDKFTLLNKSPKEILALDKDKFKTPPPMTTLVEKRNSNKFCEFHGEVGHNTDECMHLKRQIEEMIKAGMLSHLIKEVARNSQKQ
ncbi:hypothetical protein Tco_1039702 [Tanacetum coccineum]